MVFEQFGTLFIRIEWAISLDCYRMHCRLAERAFVTALEACLCKANVLCECFSRHFNQNAVKTDNIRNLNPSFVSFYHLEFFSSCLSRQSAKRLSLDVIGGLLDQIAYYQVISVWWTPVVFCVSVGTIVEYWSDFLKVLCL